MKTLLFCLFAIILAGASLVVSAQDYTTNTKSGEYKLRHNGSIQTPYYGSQKDARSAAETMSNECHVRTGGGLCTVAVQQPELIITTVSTKSSSKSQSSVISSTSRQSSSSPARKVAANWKCTLMREDGTPMLETEIGGYLLQTGDTTPINIKHTGCEMSHIIDLPAPGLSVQVAEYDTDNIVSKYITFP